MVTLSEGMVQLNIPIPEDLRERIDDLIIHRYGYTKRGLLGAMVTEAIQEYLDKRIPVESHTHPQTPPKKVEGGNNEPYKKEKTPLLNTRVSSNKYDKLVDLLKRYANREDENKISLGTVKRCIRTVMGQDERTVDKYLTLLTEDSILGRTDNMNFFIDTWLYDEFSNSQKQKEQETPNTIKSI